MKDLQEKDESISEDDYTEITIKCREEIYTLDDRCDVEDGFDGYHSSTMRKGDSIRIWVNDKPLEDDVLDDIMKRSDAQKVDEIDLAQDHPDVLKSTHYINKCICTFNIPTKDFHPSNLLLLPVHCYYHRKSAEKAFQLSQRGYFLDTIKYGDTMIYAEEVEHNGISGCTYYKEGATHEYVDLGLSVKWATCNVGAYEPEEYGSYYAWGETETKDEYTEENCLTRGKKISEFSGNPEFDVATRLWGDDWRMPTKAEIEELIENTTGEFSDIGGVMGFLVTSCKNGNRIFLPAASNSYDGEPYDDGIEGLYWSATPYEDDDEDDEEYKNIGAYHLVFDNDENCNCYGSDYDGPNRYMAYTIRPVHD